jgi:hypothetical protein
LVEHECNIVESQQFTDRGLRRFFMRVQFEPTHEHPVDLPALREDFGAAADQFGMAWRFAGGGPEATGAGAREQVRALLERSAVPDRERRAEHKDRGGGVEPRLLTAG